MSEKRIEVFYINGEVSHAYIPLEDLPNLQIKGISGPSNLRWVKHVNFVKPMEYRSPKTQKRLLQALDYAKNDLGLKIDEQNVIQKDSYLEWLNLYQSNILNKEIGELRLDKNWFDEKGEDIQKYAAIFIKDKNNKIIAGVILKKDYPKVSCSFRAHEYMHIKSSNLAALLEFLIDSYALTYNYTLITRGTDVNVYGIRLTKGLIDFKIENGFTPTALDNTNQYYPRKLIFFKLYAEIFTYVYSHDNPSALILNHFTQDQLEEYTYNLDILRHLK